MGLYTGGIAMQGEKGRDFRKLKKEIERQQAAYKKGMKKRKKWGFLGDVVKTFFPGAGHLADLLIEQVAQKNIGIGKSGKIKGMETGWTSGQAGKMGTRFAEQQEASKQSLLEGLLTQGLDFAGSKLGGEIFEGLGDKFGKTDFGKGLKEFQEGAKDWQKEILGLVEMERAVNKPTAFDPLEYLAQGGYGELREPRLSFQEGGQVPEQQLMQLLALAQAQQQTAYDGTPLEEGSEEGSEGASEQGKGATIADYFGMQGKSLGGSNQQSLSQMLGR